MELKRKTPEARGVIMLGAIGMAVIGQLYLSLPLALKVSHSFSDAGSAWLLGAAFGAAYAAGFLLLPPLTGRANPRTVLTAALAALAPVTLLAALAPSWPVLVAARAAQGLAGSAFTPAVLGFLACHLPPARRVRAAGLIGACFLLAVVVAQVIGQLGAQALGWRGLLAATSVLYGLAALAVSIRIPREPLYTPHSPGHGSSRYTSLLRMAARPDMRVILAISLAPLAGLVALYAALASASDLGDAELLWVRLACAPALALAWPAGRVGESYGARRLLLAGLTLCITGGFVVTVITIAFTPVAGLIVGLEISSIGVAAIIPALMESVSVADPSGAMGPALYLFALFTGATLAGLVDVPTAVLGLLLAVVHLQGAVLLLVTRARIDAISQPH